MVLVVQELKKTERLMFLIIVIRNSPACTCSDVCSLITPAYSPIISSNDDDDDDNDDYDDGNFLDLSILMAYLIHQ